MDRLINKIIHGGTEKSNRFSLMGVSIFFLFIYLNLSPSVYVSLSVSLSLCPFPSLPLFFSPTFSQFHFLSPPSKRNTIFQVLLFFLFLSLFFANYFLFFGSEVLRMFPHFNFKLRLTSVRAVSSEDLRQIPRPANSGTENNNNEK